MEKFNRLNDLFFKYLLGTEARKDLTLAFLNAILADGEERFKDIIFINKDLEPAKFLGKLSKLDVKGVLDSGELIDIEVQVCPYDAMSERSLYYWARMYSEELSESEQYEALKPAIVLNILNYNHIKDEENWHNVYRLLNTNSHKMLTDHLEIHYVELPKLKLSDVRSMKSGEKWAAYLSGKCSKEEMYMLAVTDPNIIKALEAEKYFIGSNEYREYYEEREKAIRDYNSFLSSAKREGLNAGMTIGMEHGLKQGMAKGLERGVEQGKEQMVRSLNKEGVSLELIARASGYSLAEVKRILS